MAIPSPFEGLQIDQELVCEFFAVFARFEFALKESGFARNQRGIVEPAWWRFAKAMAECVTVNPGSDLEKAINFLCGEPPQVQTGPQTWKNRDLHGATRVEQAIDASRRVRNSLFHGGKHTPHSPPGRDERLVRSSLTVLFACLEQNEELRETYVSKKVLTRP